MAPGTENKRAVAMTAANRTTRSRRIRCTFTGANRKEMDPTTLDPDGAT